MIAYTHINLIDALRAENAALKEQVAQLKDCAADYDTKFEQMELETLSLQSKSAALVDALGTIKSGVGNKNFSDLLSDRQMASIAEAALAAFKEPSC